MRRRDGNEEGSADQGPSAGEQEAILSVHQPSVPIVPHVALTALAEILDAEAQRAGSSRFMFIAVFESLSLDRQKKKSFVALFP